VIKSITNIALLRGINVGGNNILKMSDLKTCFENLGFTNVRTYIQSGNVIFDAMQKPQELTRIIEAELTKRYKYKARAVVISAKQLKTAVYRAPKNFGKAPDTYRYDVIFLKPPLTAAEALVEIPVKKGVDEVFEGTDVLYFSRLIKKATQSKLSRVVALPIYQEMTIRNWNTTTKVLSLIEAQK